MASGADNDGGIDGVGVHARLVVVVHGDQGPVGDDTSNSDGSVGILAGDEVLNGGGVEELDVRELEDLGKEGRGEESSVLDDDIVALIFICDANLLEEALGRLAHDHGAEELTTEPGTTTYTVLVGCNTLMCEKAAHTRRDTGFDNGNLQVGAVLCKDVCSAKTARSSANNYDIGLGVLVQIRKVPPGHSTGDLGLADGCKVEVGPFSVGGLCGDYVGVGVTKGLCLDGIIGVVDGGGRKGNRGSHLKWLG